MVYADKRSFCIFKKFYNTVDKKEPFSLKKLFLVIISTIGRCRQTPGAFYITYNKYNYPLRNAKHI